MMYKMLQELIFAPIYIFQMGKVGSLSLKSTLKAVCYGPVVHAHVSKVFSKKEETILRWRRRLGLPIYVICPIREPLSRNVSAFFQNFNRDTGFQLADKKWTSDELLDLFLYHYPHNECLEWFDKNLRTTFSVDVFAKPFQIQRKWDVYKSNSINVLVYRSDLDRSEQLDLVSTFVGKKLDSWVLDNVSSEKDYGELYNNFVRSLTLPEIYMAIMCGSRFCQHFWSKEEIEIIKNKYRV